MQRYLTASQRNTWPKLSRIQNHFIFERTLRACEAVLAAKLKTERSKGVIRGPTVEPPMARTVSELYVDNDSLYEGVDEDELDGKDVEVAQAGHSVDIAVGSVERTMTGDTAGAEADGQASLVNGMNDTGSMALTEGLLKRTSEKPSLQ